MDDLELRSVRCCEQNELALMIVRRFGTKTTRCKSYCPTSLKRNVGLLMKDLAVESQALFDQALIAEDDLEATTISLLEENNLRALLERIRLEAPVGSSDRFGLHWNITDESSSSASVPQADVRYLFDGQDRLGERARNAALTVNQELKIRAMDLLVSFFQSMLNGKDSLAAAKAMSLSAAEVLIAVRCRALKNGASIGQTAESFVLRSRKGQIEPTDDLAPHIVPLAAYVDTIHLLRRLIEDATSDFTACIDKVLRILSKQIVAHWKGSTELQCSLGKARDIMLAEVEIAQSNMNVIEAIFGSSPQRTASHGGSMVGRPLMKLVQSLVDRWTILLHRPSASIEGSPSQSLSYRSLLQLLSTSKITKENDGVEETQSVTADDRTPQRALRELNRTYRMASFLNDDTPPEKCVQTEAMRIIHPSEDKENRPPSTLPEETPKRSVKRPAVDVTDRARQKKKKLSCKQSINQPKISHFFQKM